MSEFSWKHRSGAAQIATANEIVLVRFTEPPPTSVFAVYRSALDEVLAASARRAALVHLAEVGPVNRDRTNLQIELTKIMREYDGKLAAAAMVVLARGFLNAMVRSVASGIVSVVRPKTKLALVDDIAAAAAHVAAARGDRDPAALTQLLERFALQAREPLAVDR